jgi:GntR family transcriptional regulator
VGREFFNPYPKYLQIREALTRRIDRDMTVGEQLPTEQALCEQFNVSRETVREALRGLEEEGLISRTPGRGTFIRRRPPRLVESRLTGLPEDFSALRFDTVARTLGAGPVRPSPDVAERLGAAADEMVYRIARLRFLDGEPFAFHEAFLPLDIGSGLGRLDLSKSAPLREIRETLHVDAAEDHVKIEAIAADAEIAARLDVGVGAPLLMVTRHFVFRGARGAGLFRSIFRADRYYYTVQFDRKEAGRARPAARAAVKRPSGGRHRNGARPK